jgi:hypothetical protein
MINYFLLETPFNLGLISCLIFSFLFYILSL